MGLVPVFLENMVRFEIHERRVYGEPDVDRVKRSGVVVVRWRAVAPCVRPLSEWRVAQRR